MPVPLWLGGRTPSLDFLIPKRGLHCRHLKPRSKSKDGIFGILWGIETLDVLQSLFAPYRMQFAPLYPSL